MKHLPQPSRIRDAIRTLVLLTLPLGACATGVPSAGEAPLRNLSVVPVATADLVRLGNGALDAGDHRQAYVHYSRVLQTDPENPEALVGMGESYLAAGNLKKAVLAFDKAKESPLSALALQGKGIASLRLGDNKVARPTLLAATQRDPLLWRAWNALGCSFDLDGVWARADSAYMRALQIKPDEAEIHNNRGVSLLLQKRFAEALKEFEAALRLSPRLAKTRENRRLALAYLGRYLDATSTVPRDGRPAVLNNVGFAAMQKGDYALAERYLQEALEASASYYEKAANNLEMLQYKRRRHEQPQRSL